MAESLDTANEIKTIRLKIEAIESTQEIILRHNAREYREEITSLFKDDEELRRVYLAIDGKRSQAELVTDLNASGASISQSTVSRRMNKLEGEGLIQKVGGSPAGVIWSKKDVIERVLRLSRHLANEQRKPSRDSNK